MDEGRFTVRPVRHPDGRMSHWIFGPDGRLHEPSLPVLTPHSPATQQTYAYSLIDHLNWLHANGRTEATVRLEDLLRYMNALTAQADAGVSGVVWRRGDQQPLSRAAAGNVATVVKAYYLSLPLSAGVQPELRAALSPRRYAGRRRMEEGNPLMPRRAQRRPRYLPDEVVEALFAPEVLRSARDVMIVTWLHDGGLRVGGLCGLRFCDLHLIRHHPCGQREDPHVHVVGRDDNPNGARAKVYRAAAAGGDGVVLDGVIRAVSPDMISTYHAYLLDEYHAVQHLVSHEQVLVHTAGRSAGAALTTAGVRKMLQRACARAGLDARVTPHAFRHKAAAAFLVATDFNAEMVAQEFGWSNADMVTQLYGKSANRHAMAFLSAAWEASARPGTETFLASGGSS